MFAFDDILEEWASKYIPISHPMGDDDIKPRDKRFFRIDRLDTENEWSRNETMIDAPCVLFSTAVDAELVKDKPKQTSYAYGLYIAVPQQSINNASDDRDAADCKKLLNEITLDLMAYLFQLKEEAASGLSKRDSETNLGLKGLRLESTRWWSAPRWRSKWWLMGIEIEGIDARKLCVVASKYKSE